MENYFKRKMNKNFKNIYKQLKIKMASLLFSALSGIGSSLLSNLASSAAETIGQIGSKAVKTIGQVATRRLERTVKNKPQLDNKELTVIKG